MFRKNDIKMSTVTTEKTRRSRSWNLQSIFTLKFRSSSEIKPSRIVKHPVWVIWYESYSMTYVNFKRRKKTPETKRKHPFKPKDISSSISFDNSLPNKNYIQACCTQEFSGHTGIWIILHDTTSIVDHFKKQELKKHHFVVKNACLNISER